ncbi:peptide MFS transporter [Sphingobacterium spiritivorum]|uniref:Amino acid/peptide transporter n=1 Tax=Sphingobacterium spiritivorum ATCC 33861 TaxID=525373 RepID=D7VSU5_SPHSI|nr:peptide MFS transporter [Sphingobacterium spiritivorum]EFK56846.1 amino acid/peptide transporter [Sphingobacterium spiritivorum ATCC 33861]QQT35130.1 peptide MFS transporter [Sphingobacterium spiritivorum]WQD36034.1 peptide MFS transporter [Sphingobacterium spiritivorum]SUJ03506.1 Probable dipeptide and tripeptide permease YjdL [Sphingobacterium spiritivorum]
MNDQNRAVSGTLEKDGIDGSTVLGHPSGLLVLFFTEMWERFSYYGMRVLLIQFLTSAVIFGSPFSGWGWTAEQAGALYGTYAMLVYLTPILGGIIADKYIGSRKAVIIGAAVMTIGHAAMAFDNSYMFFAGLACLIIGTGFFKPNMPSILGEMYKHLPEKKDGAYTIFYMGVNAGAFFGMMLCGYLAEKVGWHWGFGLAGIFMFLGTIQFWAAKPLMGNLGVLDKSAKEDAEKKVMESEEESKRNPYTTFDMVLIGFITVVGFMYAFNDPLSKNGVVDIFKFIDTSYLRGQYLMIFIALIAFIYLIVSRILRYGKIVRDRMFAVILLAFFLIFFFMSFEQGATSLVLVARDHIDRQLSGNSLMIFNIVNALFTIVPLTIISWVLILLTKATWKKIAPSNIILLICFVLIWGAAIWMLTNEFTAKTSEITVSWFSTLNSFFIIALASSVSKIWESKFNPSAAFKYGFGLVLVAIGFLILGLGSLGISEHVKISMIFLVLTYLFHTLGELFISPVGLSYVSKLVPARMLAFMFGVWYLAIAIAQKLAAILGGQVEIIKENYSLSHFFFLFTIIPAAAGLLVMLLNPLIKRLMHGVK